MSWQDPYQRAVRWNLANGSKELAISMEMPPAIWAVIKKRAWLDPAG
jgi:hypothetical protein